MANYSEVLKKLVDENVISQDDVKVLEESFSAAVSDKAVKLVEEQKEAEAKFDQAVESKVADLVEEAKRTIEASNDKIIEEAINNGLTAKIKVVEEETAKYREMLQESVLQYVSDYVEEEFLPHVKKSITEEVDKVVKSQTGEEDEEDKAEEATPTEGKEKPVDGTSTDETVKDETTTEEVPADETSNEEVPTEGDENTDADASTEDEADEVKANEQRAKIKELLKIKLAGKTEEENTTEETDTESTDESEETDVEEEEKKPMSLKDRILKAKKASSVEESKTSLKDKILAAKTSKGEVAEESIRRVRKTVNETKKLTEESKVEKLIVAATRGLPVAQKKTIERRFSNKPLSFVEEKLNKFVDSLIEESVNTEKVPKSNRMKIIADDTTPSVVIEENINTNKSTNSLISEVRSFLN